MSIIYGVWICKAEYQQMKILELSSVSPLRWELIFYSMQDIGFYFHSLRTDKWFALSVSHRFFSKRLTLSTHLIDFTNWKNRMKWNSLSHRKFGFYLFDTLEFDGKIGFSISSAGNVLISKYHSKLQSVRNPICNHGEPNRRFCSDVTEIVI